MPIPLRRFGKSQDHISALGFGGHHLGDAEDEATAMRLVAAAIDGLVPGATWAGWAWALFLVTMLSE